MGIKYIYIYFLKALKCLKTQFKTFLHKTLGLETPNLVYNYAAFFFFFLQLKPALQNKSTCHRLRPLNLDTTIIQEAQEVLCSKPH